MKHLAAKLVMFGAAGAFALGSPPRRRRRSRLRGWLDARCTGDPERVIRIPVRQQRRQRVLQRGRSAAGSRHHGKLVDFGASDAPLTAAQTSACSVCVQIRDSERDRRGLQLPSNPNYSFRQGTGGDLHGPDHQLGRSRNQGASTKARRTAEPGDHAGLAQRRVGDSFVFTAFLSAAIRLQHRVRRGAAAGLQGRDGLRAALASQPRSPLPRAQWLHLDLLRHEGNCTARRSRTVRAFVHRSGEYDRRSDLYQARRWSPIKSRSSHYVAKSKYTPLR